MNPINRQREIRELELFLFGGVAETPRSVYDRTPRANSELRKTRGAPHRLRAQDEVLDGIELGEYDFELGEE